MNTTLELLLANPDDPILDDTPMRNEELPDWCYHGNTYMVDPLQVALISLSWIEQLPVQYEPELIGGDNGPVRSRDN